MSVIGTAFAVAFILNSRIHNIDTLEENAFQEKRKTLFNPLSADFKQDVPFSVPITSDPIEEQFVLLNEEIRGRHSNDNTDPFLEPSRNDHLNLFQYRQKREHRYMPYPIEYHQHGVTNLQETKAIENQKNFPRIQDRVASSNSHEHQKVLTNNHQQRELSILKNISRRHGLGFEDPRQIYNDPALEDNYQKGLADHLKHNGPIPTDTFQRKQLVSTADNSSKIVITNNHKEWDTPFLVNGKRRENISGKYQVPNFLITKHYSQNTQNNSVKQSVTTIRQTEDNNNYLPEKFNKFQVGQQRNLTEQRVNSFALKVQGNSSKLDQHQTDNRDQQNYPNSSKSHRNVTVHHQSLEDRLSFQPRPNLPKNIKQRHNGTYQDYSLSGTFHPNSTDNLKHSEVQLHPTNPQNQFESSHYYPPTRKPQNRQDMIQQTISFLALKRQFPLVLDENRQSSVIPVENHQTSLIPAENRQSNRPPTWSNPPSVPWVDDPPVGQGTGLLPIVYLLAPLVVTAMLMPIGATLITAIVMLRSHHQIRGQGTQNKLDGNISPIHKTLEENLVDAWSKVEEALSKYL
ncbi:hypothetical protein JTE90_007938 [Oedothorax gibbosus]|uniref:Uncharacterized protein n=1 Tax=Oedothorax gibbosus TaxID=931172 RepID=A0AAV6VJB1_9ARAC|nr:hypothetical protein JTE90_007938 [Oedothorax gibbosus]